MGARVEVSGVPYRTKKNTSTSVVRWKKWITGVLALFGSDHARQDFGKHEEQSWMWAAPMGGKIQISRYQVW